MGLARIGPVYWTCGSREEVQRASKAGESAREITGSYELISLPRFNEDFDGTG
jgi:hypothetical protein